MSYTEFEGKFLTGKPVYFKYDFEEGVIRFDGKDKYYVKFKGKPGFLAKANSKLVADGFLEQTEISKAEYENW